MDVIKTTGFCEMTADETHEINGGVVPPIVPILVFVICSIIYANKV